MADVVLASLPWRLLTMPSIQLGILESVLHEHNISVETCSFDLTWMRELRDARCPNGTSGLLTAAEYDYLANSSHRHGLAEWVFAVPPFREGPSDSDDAKYYAFARSKGVAHDLLVRCLEARKLVPRFAEACARDILAHRPRVVGFTSSFMQNVASLLVARHLKTLAPDIVIVFGGANCEGPMGEALIKTFEQVDVVVRGEGERLLPRIVRSVLESRPLEAQPAMCWRERSYVHVDRRPPEVTPISEVPLPTYDEYFRRLEETGLDKEFRAQVTLPFESSRGCWWGAKTHCTFCGLNGESMFFRSKDPQQVFDNLVTLASRYKQLRFMSVDNILDWRYFQSLLPALRDAPYHFDLFYEVKGNMTKEQVQLLRDAGVRQIQPGLESLSTPILKLMRKGISALQNIRLLKWCAEYGVRATWNIICGFPGEPRDAYLRMANLCDLLCHLEPPNLLRLGLDRFSPYHSTPGAYGLTNVRPKAMYEHFYAVPQSILSDLAYSFDFEERQEDVGLASLREAANRWKRRRASGGHTLTYREGPGFLLITDTRQGGLAEYSLTGWRARAYHHCDAGATVSQVRDSILSDGLTVSDESLNFGLNECVQRGLMYEEEGRFLSLAVSDSVH